MFVGTILSYLLAKERKSYIQIMEEIEILPPKVDSESVAILKEVNGFTCIRAVKRRGF